MTVFSQDEFNQLWPKMKEGILYKAPDGQMRKHSEKAKSWKEDSVTESIPRYAQILITSPDQLSDEDNWIRGMAKMHAKENPGDYAENARRLIEAWNASHPGKPWSSENQIAYNNLNRIYEEANDKDYSFGMSAPVNLAEKYKDRPVYDQDAMLAAVKDINANKYKTARTSNQNHKTQASVESWNAQEYGSTRALAALGESISVTAQNIGRAVGIGTQRQYDLANEIRATKESSAPLVDPNKPWYDLDNLGVQIVEFLPKLRMMQVGGGGIKGTALAFGPDTWFAAKDEARARGASESQANTIAAASTIPQILLYSIGFKGLLPTGFMEKIGGPQGLIGKVTEYFAKRPLASYFAHTASSTGVIGTAAGWNEFVQELGEWGRGQGGPSVERILTKAAESAKHSAFLMGVMNLPGLVAKIESRNKTPSREDAKQLHFPPEMSRDEASRARYYRDNEDLIKEIARQQEKSKPPEVPAQPKGEMKDAIEEQSPTTPDAGGGPRPEVRQESGRPAESGEGVLPGRPAETPPEAVAKPIKMTGAPHSPEYVPPSKEEVSSYVEKYNLSHRKGFDNKNLVIKRDGKKANLFLSLNHRFEDGSAILVDRQNRVYLESGGEIREQSPKQIESIRQRLEDDFKRDHENSFRAWHQFDKPAEELARAIQRETGYDVEIRHPEDSNSRYVYVDIPGEKPFKIRFASHPQPKMWKEGKIKPVGGYDTSAQKRHEAADISIDPETNLTAEDTLSAVLDIRRRPGSQEGALPKIETRTEVPSAEAPPPTVAITPEAIQERAAAKRRQGIAASRAEAVAEKELREEQEIAAKYPPGTELKIKGYPHSLFVVDNKGELRDGPRSMGNAAEVLRRHKNDITVINSAKQAGPQAKEIPKTPEPVKPAEAAKENPSAEKQPEADAGGAGGGFHAQAMPQGAEPGKADYIRRGATMEVPDLEAAQVSEAKRRRIEAQPVPMPEMIQLVKEFLGSAPTVKKLRRYLGFFQHKEGSGMARMVINAIAAKDEQLLAKVLAHEAGHLIDWLPDQTTKRGNILGRIASLRNYKDQWLAAEPGAPGPLTDAERARLRREAERVSKQGAEIEIEEEIVQRFNITPEDILAIWNSVEANVPPELLSYVKRMSAAEKLSLVKEAFRGVVPEEVQQFAREVRTKTGRTVKQVVEKDATPEEIHAKYLELLRKEIEARRLLSMEKIREELIRLTEWWTPFDRRTSSEKYIKYRESSTELYAEALSVLLNSPHELASRAPEFYRGFTGWLNEKPELLDSYFKLQEILNGGADNLSAMRESIRHNMYLDAAQKIAAAEAARDATKGNPLQRARNTLWQYLLDRAGPLKSAGKKSGSAEGLAAYYALDELSYRESKTHEMLSRVKEEAADAIFAAGITENDIGDYLMLRRVVNERNEIANPLGYTPTEAKQELDFLRRKLGEAKYTLLEEKMKRWHDILFEAVEEAVAEGVYSQKNFEKIKPNKDNYATFAVIKYLEDYVTPAIREQIGTFEGIANPWDATTMKFVALRRLIELNRAKNRVRDFMLKDFKGEITKAEMSYRQTKPSKPAKDGYDYLMILEDGKMVAYEVPAEVAKSFMRHDIGGLDRIGQVINSKTYPLFHAFFVKYSPGFLAANPFRDLRRTWKSLGAYGNAWNKELQGELIAKGMTPEQAKEAASPMKITLGQVLSTWWKARGEAKAFMDRHETALVHEMFASRALSTPYVEVTAELGDTSKAGRLMEQYGLKEPTRKDRAKMIVWAGKVLELLQREGAKQEYASKIAAWNLISERARIANGLGVDLISPQEKSLIVRRYVGTPDWKQGGLAKNVTNTYWMYSNVKFQGLLADAELATNPRTRGGYWWRTLVSDVVPTTITKLGKYGVYGAAIAAIYQSLGGSDDESEKLKKSVNKMYRRIGGYYLDNYDVLPLGTISDPSGREDKDKTLLITIPKDESGRIMSRIWGACMDFIAEKAGVDTSKAPNTVLKELYGIAGDSVMPTEAPAFDIANKWSQFFAGVNPYDDFYKSGIIPKTEWEAGGWAATRKMLAWTEGKMGVAGQLTHFITAPILGQRFTPEDETTVEQVLKIPFGPHRFIRIDNSGLRAEENTQIQMDDQEQARFRLGLPEEARYIVKEYYRGRDLDEEKLSPERKDEIARYGRWYYNVYLKITREMKAYPDRREKLRELLQAEAQAMLKRKT